MHYSKNKLLKKDPKTVDNLSKICYNIITLPMGEGPEPGESFSRAEATPQNKMKKRYDFG